MAVSKVVYGSNTLVDLTADTVKADKLLSGYTAHGANGNKITGTFAPSTAKMAYGSFTGNGASSYTITGIGFTPTRFILLCTSKVTNGDLNGFTGAFYDGSSGKVYQIYYAAGYAGNEPNNNAPFTIGNGTVTFGYWARHTVAGVSYQWIAIAE